jgi:hypothetical protein
MSFIIQLLMKLRVALERNDFAGFSRTGRANVFNARKLPFSRAGRQYESDLDRPYDTCPTARLG